MKIMYLNGTLTGQTVELPPGGATIGRESDNTIQIPMGGVSRYHAKIEQDPAGNWQIRDLGSTNGTQVDDFPVVGAARLVNGSVITIGDQLLRCMDSASASASAPSAQTPSAQTPSAQTPSASPSQSQSQPTFFFRPQNATTNTPIQEQPAPAASSQSSAGPVSQTPPPAPAPSITEADISRGLFNKNKKQNKPSRGINPKKLIGNVIFTLIVILAACLGLWIFLKLNEAPSAPVQQAPVKKKVVNPFVLYYEKESVEDSSVFRFSLLIEGRKEKVENDREELHYIMEVTLDEPKNKRRYYELFKEPLPEDLIKSLEEQIQSSGFMELQQEKIAGTSQDNRQHRRIMVGFANQFCDVNVSNDVSQTFNRVEDIINETVLEKYDLGVVSQNVDQILSDAKKYLFEAENEFASIDITPSNLPKAITNYRHALRRYDLFSPKPSEWKVAHDGLERAEAKVEELYQQGRKNIIFLYERFDYEKAIAECNRLLEIFPPESERHKKIRENKLKIEDKLTLRNK